MKVLVHIGQSKTGTSAIQAYLTLNRVPLASQGVLYPAVRVAGVPVEIANHNALADSLSGLSRFPHLSADEYFRQFWREAAQCRAELMILSAEHFFGGEPRVWNVSGEDDYFRLYREKVRALGQQLRGHDVEVLVYLRPQVDWLESAIGQTVRISQLISQPSPYANDRQFFELMKPVLRYGKLLDIWEEELDHRRIRVIPYQRDALIRQSAIDDFIARCGLAQFNFPYGHGGLEVNASFTREYVEVKKRLNEIPRSKLSESVVIECLTRLSKMGEFSQRYYLDPALSAEVARFAAAENEPVNRRFLDAESSLVAQSGTRTGMAQPDTADIDRAMAAFERMYRGPRMRLLMLSLAIRDALRRRAPALHAHLHQLKRLYRTWRYKS
jgi:hypothetical protein